LPSNIGIESSAANADLVILQPAEPVTPVHDTAAALEAQLDQLKTEIKQERFTWITALTGVIIALIFMALPWYGAIFCVLFSLVLLLVAARTCEVPWIVTHLERIFDRASVSASQEEPPPSGSRNGSRAHSQGAPKR
jgi:uncharacterized membrane protein